MCLFACLINLNYWNAYIDLVSFMFIFYLHPPRRLCNHWRLFVRLFVCEQHNSKTYLWISFKFSHIVHIYLSNSWLNFGSPNWPNFEVLTKIWQKFSPWISILSHNHSCSQETLALLFSFPQMGLDWTFMGPLPGRRSVLYECNSLVGQALYSLAE